MAEEIEIWKDIVGFEGYYKISSFGRVQSCERIVPRITNCYPNKWPFIKIKARLLKGHVNQDGYLVFNLCKNEIKKGFMAHRLVASAFLSKLAYHSEVNHIDANKKNNRLSNLEWCSHLENMQHAASLKLLDNTGSKNPRAILNESQVLEIKQRLLKGEGVCAIAKVYGVNRLSIGDIKQGRAWKHVTI